MNSWIQKTDWWLSEAGSRITGGRMSESGPQVQASSYKISPGDVRHSMVSLVKIPYWISEHC